MNKALCIIPARGGSKRIPRKNIKDFLGKPIITYSIEIALQSELFDEVMVSTDNEEIAEVATAYGASVPFMRSAKNADDFASTMDVISEVVKKYEQQEITYKLICCIYPTAPLIRIDHLQKGLLKLMENNKLNAVFPVTLFSYPVWRGLKRDTEGYTAMYWPEYLNTRSQDLPEVYHDAGQWYWFKRPGIGKPIFGEQSGSIVLKEEEVQDIDNLADWRLAELKYEYLQSIK